MVIEEPAITMVTEDISSSTTWCVCLKEISDAHTCRMCSRNVHAICGHSPKDDGDNEVEGYKVSILGTVCFNIEKVIQKNGIEIEPRNAKRMKRGSETKFPPASLEATV